MDNIPSRSFRKWFSVAWLLGIALFLVVASGLTAFAQSGDTGETASGSSTTTLKQTPYFTHKVTTAPGKASLDEYIINGPPTPPPGYDLERKAVPMPLTETKADALTLTTPAFNWVFGCSSVSGAMIAGYYDRNGYPNMYTGPTNGGVMPLDNSSWPTWTDTVGKSYPNLPLAASHNGVDGRTTRGSIDDYWISYGSSAQDPYITGAWTQHVWSDAIGDYMKTSQSAYSNTDGSTTFWTWTSSPDRLTCDDMVDNNITRDGTYGRKLFYEARGYTVTDCYNQKTDNNGGGFAFANYKAEIDAGHPVMLNVEGHTMVGVGYDESTNTVYLHDTWDYDTHSMPWGGSYSGMALLSVSIVNLQPVASTGSLRVTLLPAAAVTAGAQWRVDGGSWQASAATVSGLSVGTHTVSFKAIDGYTTPANQTVTINTGATTNATGTYRAASSSGGANLMLLDVPAVFSIGGGNGPTNGFNEQFTSSLSNWTQYHGSWSIVNGSAHIQGTSSGTWLSLGYKKANFGTLDYSVRMQNTNSEFYANAIVVRGDPEPLQSDFDWNSYYYFGYENTGYFTIGRWVDGVWYSEGGWLSSSAIVPYGWNILRITASGSTLYFYINGTVVGTLTDSILTTGTVGILFYDGSGCNVNVDYATLSTTVSSASKLNVAGHASALKGDSRKGTR